MLDFFRKYQRYFFFIITIVIIISFSFFGTYSTIDSRPNVWREEIAFTAINGHEVSRFDVEEMAQFLATDSQDKLNGGGAWGPNFLNDGVIRKDLLERGLGEEIILAYPKDLQSDLEIRHAKEKKFKLYSHPDARFVGVESIWTYFLPEMNGNFRSLQASNHPLDKESVKNRIVLFLGDKQIPQQTLRYLLSYQEKQYSWLKPDPILYQADLSLFGHHTLEDWFGPAFIRLASEYIMNCALIAEEQGYKVTKEEALADLLLHAQTSYKENKDNPNIGVASFQEYFAEQLRRMNMDQARAVKIWQQVLLFRRYFQDAGNESLVDSATIKTIRNFANESVTIDLYRLPKALRLGDFETLQNFESYLYAVTKQDKQKPLLVPEEYLPLAKVEAKYPELVQKKYELEIKKANQSDLLAKVTLRDLWKWESDEQNWALLQKEFPLLGTKTASDESSRSDVIDDLDETTRSKVDAFAKKSIVKAHPEWVEAALSQAEPEGISVGFREEGGKLPFAGLDKKEQRQALAELLDKAPLGEAPEVDSPLARYSPDAQTYYSIKVLSRADKPEIVTFAEAQKDGTLKALTTKLLEKYYKTIREEAAATYKDKGEWKSLASVREEISDKYYAKILEAIRDAQKAIDPNDEKREKSKDQLAKLRLYTYVEEIKEKIKADPAAVAALTIEKEEESSPSLADQWKLEKKRETITRESNQSGEEFAQLKQLNPSEWSTTKSTPTGDIVFAQLISKGEGASETEALAEQIRQIHDVIAAEAKRELMTATLEKLQEKGALSVSYLKKAEEEAKEGE